MQGVPYYQNYPGNGPFYHPQYPSGDDPRVNSEQRTRRRRHSMDTGDNHAEAETWELESSTRSQDDADVEHKPSGSYEASRRGSRSRKKKSGMVVIRNINYVTSKSEDLSGSDLESASGSEDGEKTRLEAKLKSSKKGKRSNLESMDELNAVSGKNAGGAQWDAFQTYLLKDADEAAHADKSAMFASEKDVRGKRRPNASRDDPLSYEEREGGYAQGWDANAVQEISGKWSDRRRTSSDAMLVSGRTGHSVDGSGLVGGQVDLQSSEINGIEGSYRRESDDFIMHGPQQTEPMQSTAAEKSSTTSPHSSWLVGVSCLSLVVGSVASTLLSKFYFSHGGSSIWLSTVIQSVGFPLLLPIIFLAPSTAHRRAFSGITPTMFCASFVVGLVMGAATWLTSWGINSLPMSTTYLLLSSEVVFSRFLNVLIGRERLTFHNINTVVFLIVSYVFLVLAESHDRVAGVSEGSYLVGFFFAMGAGLLPVLYLPIVEGVQRRLTSYVMLVEIQVIMQVAATGFALVGMAAGSFAFLWRESSLFDAGEVIYWATVAANVVASQLYLMGTAGTRLVTSSFTRGILTVVVMVLNIGEGVLVYGEYFHGVKVMATIVCAWGLSSNAYGEYVGRRLGGGAGGGGGPGGAGCVVEMVEQPEVVADLDEEDRVAAVPVEGMVDLVVDVAEDTGEVVVPVECTTTVAEKPEDTGAAVGAEGELTTFSLSDQLPSAQGLFQPPQSQSPFTVNQLPSTLGTVGSQVIVNQKIAAWGLHLHFQRAVPISIDRAIKEIVTGIVQRSVSIATQTTKELVLKDYAMESDETRIYNAAHLMVASLAGSLAHVTCKEPLRSSISIQLRNLLQGLSIASELLEHAVQLATNDNLDLGCAIIEQAAADKAVQSIDGEIGQQLLRRKHRHATFFDANMYAQGSMGIPEALRPKSGHLSVSQQRVYEDFVRLPWQNQSTQVSHAAPMGSSSASGAGIAYSASEQLSTGFSSGNIGVEAASRTLDFSTEAIESNPAAVISTSSIHIGPVDGAIQQSAESSSIVASFPSTARSPELHPADSASAVKESVASQALPSSVSERNTNNLSEPSLGTRDALDKYQIIAQKLDALVIGDAKETEIQGVAAEVPEIILRCVSRDEAALAVAQKVFKGLYENAANTSHVNACLAILAAIRDVCKLVVKELTSWVIYSDEDRKFNKDITVGLIHSELLNLTEYNVHMAKLIDGGRNKAATEFCLSLVQALVVEESKVISELHNLVDALAKLAAKPGSPESLQQLIEIVRNPAANVGAVSGFTTGKVRDKKASNQSVTNREGSIEFVETDPTGLREQVLMLFAEWYHIYELPGSNDAASTHFVLQLHQNGILKSDDMANRFFHILTELSVAHCLICEVIHPSTLQTPQQTQNMSFVAIDVYAKLVFSILKVEQGANKVSLFSKILSVTLRFVQKDSEEKKTSFNPRPYFRLFINWFLDLASVDPINDSVNFQMLIAFANAFHNLQPLKVPAFSFAWLELVGHRSFMPKLLTGNAQKGWPYVQRLLVDLFQFLEPFLRNAELGGPVQFLYKGTLRVLLVLLHDFPEFLCDYHFTFCDLIPPSCIQMRNIILNAFPRNMRLPDPSTPNLKIDLLAEIREPPRILSEVDAALKVKHLKADVDEYLKTRQQNSPFLAELKQRLLLLPNEAATAGTRYNVPLINSLVLYAGMQAIQHLQTKSRHAPSMDSAPLNELFVDAALDIYSTLVQELDTEGRYLFLNAVANQLRYPNNHTHYFSFVMLYLFAEASQEIIREQITRVLLERLIVNRPHPWGLLITFIELIKNPRYNVWNKTYIRCAPEIKKLFESVARSCGGMKPMDESMVSGWAAESTH